MIKQILVRIDDVCPTMDYEKFMDRIVFFREAGIKPMLGVIPNCEDESLKYGEISNFWDMIRKFADAGYPIAMHGYKHIYTTQRRGLVCFRKLSEFSGLSYETQLIMLQQGKRILEEHGIYTNWFMAPGHSYDKQTVRALRDAGFRYVSDGRSSRPYMLYGVRFVPATSIWKSPFNGKIITLCLHPNTDSARSVGDVQRFIRENKMNISSFAESEQWDAKPYWYCRIDELVRILIEKFSLYIYTVIKAIKRSNK